MAYIKKIKLPRVETPYEILDANAVPNTRKVNGKQLNADITLTAANVGARSDTWTPSKTDIGLGNVDNVKQYSASNPPPYPVTSVNGQTGAVTIDAGGSSIPVQAATPQGQKVGDLWFKVV